MKSINVKDYGKYREGLTGGEIRYYVGELIGKDKAKRVFLDFLDLAVGQTNVTVDGKILYYRHDVKRGLDLLLKGKPIHSD